MNFLYKRVTVASDDEDDDSFSREAPVQHDNHHETTEPPATEAVKLVGTPDILLLDLNNDTETNTNASTEADLLEGFSCTPKSPHQELSEPHPPLTPATATAAMNGTLAAAATTPSSSLSPSAAATAAPAADWDHNDDIMERRELLIYALPLTADGRLTYLPVTPWTDASDSSAYLEDSAAASGDPSVSTKIKMAISSAKEKAAEAWDSMKEKDEKSIQNKIYRLGQRVIQNLTPEERMVKDIPENVSKVVIFHPSSVPPDEVMEELHSRTTKVAKSSMLRAAAAGLLLPIAFGIDILIIPGPQVLTYYSLWELYKNTNSATGTERLTRYIAQRGASNHVRVNYAGDERLDRYLERARFSGEGVLTETDIEEMVSELKEPGLLEPLMLLRDRFLSSATRGGSERDKGYVRLADHAVDESFSSGERALQ